MTDRIALFGDIGGHLVPFSEKLTELGCDLAAGTVPDGLTVIQVGDLVHRGPDSNGCIELADRFIRNSAGRYIQMLGNHEGHELGGPMMFGYDHYVDRQGLETLERWWFEQTVSIAVAIDTPDLGSFLVVHAGVTPWLWDALGRRPATETAELINSAVGGSSAHVFQPGMMLRASNVDVGPVWAEPAHELYEPWSREPVVPFGQIHGHASPWAWRNGDWRKNTPQSVIDTTTRTDTELRHLWNVIGGQTFIGIDPGHGEYPVRSWGPLLLEGTVAS